MASMEVIVKQELDVVTGNHGQALIEISSSDDSDGSSPNTSNLLQNDESEDDVFMESLKNDLRRQVNGGKSRCLDDIDDAFVAKKPKLDVPAGVVVPVGFLAPISREARAAVVQQDLTLAVVDKGDNILVRPSGRQFWKAGDYETDTNVNSSSFRVGMDHVRVHPKFLHSNATSHKWALGAFAELLDNALDEVRNGATYVVVDVLNNNRDNSKMLLVEDNGGGMTLDKLRQCMSLGYSAKSKIANTIGQYGNGFKTSTMRLGADVIVFSRCRSSGGRRESLSVGMLSYTFLKSTQQEDIVVPMIDYEKSEKGWVKNIRSSVDDWNGVLETILQWSPFVTESDLLQQFDTLKEQGTRILVYNLWEDDEGQMELDFETDPHDIQIRGVNRDEKNLKMAEQYPTSKHYLTYRHSLRSYASILYLRLPPNFKMSLRGKEVEHHDIVNDMMMAQEVTYKPMQIAEGSPNDSNMVAQVKIGFAKDAHYHIDIQGFNVYHKNRLIKPFWRVWNAAGSDGRGVIGVLEANFVEPAHDKQGFERTIGLSRLEARLVAMQKNYWSSNCQSIGYAPRRKVKKYTQRKDALPSKKSNPSFHSTQNGGMKQHAKRVNLNGDVIEDDQDSSDVDPPHDSPQPLRSYPSVLPFSNPMGVAVHENGHKSGLKLVKLEQENGLNDVNGGVMIDAITLLNELNYEKDRNKSLQKKLEESEQEQFHLVNMLAEEKKRAAEEEERLRMKLKDASNTIDELLQKVSARRLQNSTHGKCSMMK